MLGSQRGRRVRKHARRASAPAQRARRGLPQRTGLKPTSGPLTAQASSLPAKLPARTCTPCTFCRIVGKRQHACLLNEHSTLGLRRPCACPSLWGAPGQQSAGAGTPGRPAGRAAAGRGTGRPGHGRPQCVRAAAAAHARQHPALAGAPLHRLHLCRAPSPWFKTVEASRARALLKARPAITPPAGVAQAHAGAGPRSHLEGLLQWDAWP